MNHYDRHFKKVNFFKSPCLVLSGLPAATTRSAATTATATTCRCAPALTATATLALSTTTTARTTASAAPATTTTATTFGLRFGFEACCPAFVVLIGLCVVAIFIFCGLALGQTFSNGCGYILGNNSNGFCRIVVTRNRKVHFVRIAVGIHHAKRGNVQALGFGQCNMFVPDIDNEKRSRHAAQLGNTAKHFFHFLFVAR
jgi:hypothetical protein